MLFFRSLTFNVCFYVWTAVMVLAYTPTLVLPYHVIVRGQRQWASHINALLRKIAGIRVEVRGREHLPRGGCIVAAKHQSAWDTLIWHQELDDPAVVMKAELLKIPVYGWMCRKTRMLTVDRTGGSAALRQLIAQAKVAIGLGRPLVIFPQGTRAAPGASVGAVPYQPGVAALYRALDVPVVPVALNSGLFWRRHGFLRFPGTIVLEYLEPIPPGRDRKSFMAELEQRIEDSTQKLEAEARGGKAKIS